MKKYLILAIVITIFIWYNFATINKVNELEQNSSLDLIRANNAIANKKDDLALQYYLKDLEHFPDRVSTLFNIASTYAHSSTRSLSNAQKYFIKLINHPEINTHVTAKLIEDLNRLGMKEELLLLSKIASSQIILARILYLLENDKAISHIKMVPTDQHDMHYHQLYAQINFSLQHYSQAIEHITSSINLGNMSSKLFYLKNQALLRMKNYSDLKKTNKIYQIMLSLEKNTDPTKQLEVFKSLLENNTNLSDIKAFQYQLLILQLLNHEKQDAKESFGKLDTTLIDTIDREKILSVAKTTNNYWIFDELFNTLIKEKVGPSEATLYCSSHRKMFNKDQVSAFCKHAITQFPESAALHFWLGILWLTEDNIDEAINEILISINYAPWMDDWRIQLAQIYLSQGQTKLAKNIINDTTVSQKLQLFKLQNGLNND